MNKKQRAAIRRFRRVQDFLTQHPSVASAADLGKQSKELDDVLATLGAIGEEQDASSRLARADVAKQRALRLTLRNIHLAPVSRIARLVYGEPGMDVAFRMPKQRADNDALIDSARGMAQAAAKQSAVFVEHGLAPDFVDQLRAATSALVEKVGTRTEYERRRLISRQSIGQLVQRGGKAVAMLDAIVTPRLSQDTDLLATWKLVKRVIEPVVGSSPQPAEQQVVMPAIKAA